MALESDQRDLSDLIPADHLPAVLEALELTREQAEATDSEFMRVLDYYNGEWLPANQDRQADSDAVEYLDGQQPAG